MREPSTPTSGRSPVPALDRDGGSRSLAGAAVVAALVPVALWVISYPALLATVVGGGVAVQFARTVHRRRTPERTRRVCVPGTDVCTRV